METEARAVGDAVPELESIAELKDALLRGATALRVLARTSTLPAFDWDMTNACPDCVGTGEHVLNPDWPNGDAPYSEKCATCSGTGQVDKDETAKQNLQAETDILRTDAQILEDCANLMELESA